MYYDCRLRIFVFANIYLMFDIVLVHFGPYFIKTFIIYIVMFFECGYKSFIGPF